ncbi:ubiquitin fusion degradation protein UFD1-domain-containing protein [Halteromyces radiatus]|uniref:ubiquitin fusion degradation protein UFD1-domain-containing protein n=1 Tax=Halteromyces radiatus TaxID=101107 RepID=UPI00221FF989|nr:ubiquitin fusion degradation protein UFD1-domain-containing protein [Halteromyces radiatus]KAI8089300.1 ubiquitin fusion degradation protein UFD1-domain-containing protein [Halteromyces radiatus]
MFNNFDDEDPFSPSNFFNSNVRHPFAPLVNPNRQFTECYRCYPIVMMQSGSERGNVNYGGKIILPQSALEKLSQLNISYPMLFRLINASQNKHTHAGVLEFIAEEGRAYLPQWMMQTLGLEPGQLLEVKNTTLPLGSFVKIQPQSTDFLDISDPKAVLENALRNFSTLTLGDTIQINYNDKIYEIKVLDVKPHFEDHAGISIVETDLEVDFAPPVGYVEPSRSVPAPSSMSQMVLDEQTTTSGKPGFTAFHGSGQSLRNKGKEAQKAVASDQASSSPASSFDVNDDGPFNLPFGQLYFGYPVIPPKSKTANTEKSSNAFSGAGQSLRGKKTNSNKSAR